MKAARVALLLSGACLGVSILGIALHQSVVSLPAAIVGLSLYGFADQIRRGR